MSQVPFSRFAADLRWVIESPSLIQADAQSDVADPQWAPAQTFDPAALFDFLQARSGRRVGYYFEHLLHFWLQEVQGLQVLEHGRQIIEDGITRGEIDFLFRDAQQQTVHWEVAIKFYLQTQPGSEDGNHLIGPDPADNFAKKHRRLFGHQLSLSKRLPLQVDRRQGLMKGRIFYHPQQEPAATGCPLINPAHLRGVWVRQEEVQLLACRERRYCILEKPFWLGEIQTREELWPFDRLSQHLQAHFATVGHPVLLAAVEQCEGAWRECQRAFVVPTHWPAKTAE